LAQNSGNGAQVGCWNIQTRKRALAHSRASSGCACCKWIRFVGSAATGKAAVGTSGSRGRGASAVWTRSLRMLHCHAAAHAQSIGVWRQSHQSDV